MIRTTGGKLGCTPGGNCCSDCASHGASHAALGDVNCDQDGNCYDSSTGIYTPAPIASSSPLSSSVWLYAGLAGIALFVFSGSGKGRR